MRKEVAAEWRTSLGFEMDLGDLLALCRGWRGETLIFGGYHGKVLR
jgi:hypothetical protein